MPDILSRIAFITTFPPRPCGIATFSDDLIKSFDGLHAPEERSVIFALATPTQSPHVYPPEVVGVISENTMSDYERVAAAINADATIRLVSIQHEFGIFGEKYGERIIDFLSRIEKPVVITFHTVLPEPSAGMHQVVQKILNLAQRIVVMTTSSKIILQNLYAVTPEKIVVIPHGIHEVAFTDGREAKERLGLSGYKILSTFGLLGEGKGVEYGIAALPELVRQIPNVRYLIVGATHPVVLAHQGESYRNKLRELAQKLGVAEQVIFYNQYFSTAELLTFLQATDVYLALSQNPDQAVSGTLSYALGAGRPVIATAFRQARELITSEVGRLVPFTESEALSRAAFELLSDERKRHEMARLAYVTTRDMVWHNVALRYADVFEACAPELKKRKRTLPAVSFTHLKHLTDQHGIFQFASFGAPDPGWGYTLDDNARALVAAVEGVAKTSDTSLVPLAHTYLSFIERSLSSTEGMINYIDHQLVPHPTRNREENLDETVGRTLWALAVARNSPLLHSQQARIDELSRLAEERALPCTSLRALAQALKAYAVAFDRPNSKYMLVKTVARILDLYDRTVQPGWYWFEQIMSYSNGSMPEALLVAHERTGEQRYKEVGLTTLNFLIEHSFVGDMCVPIGQNGWHRVDGKKALFDQQPEEVLSLVLALKQAYTVTGDHLYAERMRQAFDWFMGNNLRRQFICNPLTGACYDGLGQGGVNVNQGAESTISYLLARLALES